MPIPGPLVHQHLMDAYAKLQAELADSRTFIMESSERRGQLDEDRAEAWKRLAEHYLPELTGEAIGQTWTEVRASITEILLRKQDQTHQLAQQLDQLNGQRQKLEQELMETNRQRDAAGERQQHVVAAIERTLHNDPAFKKLSDRAAVAEAALERAESNLAEIDQDAATKLPAYEASSLFRYLHNRNYGTSKYASRGLTRHADRWLARYIDYAHARKGYEFLRKTPESMRHIIAEDREALETVMAELERRRDQVADHCGLTEVTQQCADLDGQREALIAQLDEILVNSQRLQTQRCDLEDTRGPHYREAIKLFRDQIRRMDARDLKRRAAQTEEITDDQIVARLMGVETDIGQLDQSARNRQSQWKGVQCFMNDLGQLIQRFRAAQFDSARSQFVGSFNVLEEVDEAREKADIERLWKRLRRAQRWAPTVGDQLTQVAAHPLTQVLFNAMAHAAGGALAEHARRAGKRRSFFDQNWKKWESGFGSWGGSSDDQRRKRR